jgi:hypothetical protein
MMRLGLFLAMLGVITLAPVGLADAGDTGVTAEIVGIRVIDGAFPADEFEFLPFQGDTGTQLLVMLTSGDKQFVEVLHRDSVVTALTGGEGHDLLEKRAEKSESQFTFNSSPVSGFTRFSKDRKRALVEINAPQAPAADDAYLKLQGRLVAKVARGKERVVRKNVALKPGKLDVEGYTIAITGATRKKNFSGEKQFTVDLRFSGKAGAALESVTFLDAAGKEIKVEGRSWATIAGVTTASYPLARPVGSATLVFSFWKDPEMVMVPLDVKQTLGMGSGQQ